MSFVTSVALGGIVLSAFLCLLRVLRGTSVTDRIVALDTLLVTTVGGVAVLAVATGSGLFLDVLVVTALLGFLGTVSVARYIERRGA